MEFSSGLIDIHTHILPGVDDGAENMERSAAMIRQACDGGTRCLFLTPHYRGKYREHYDPEKFRSLAAQLQERCPEMRLILGSEVTYESAVPELLLEGKVLTLGGTEFVLLELFSKMPSSQVLRAVSETVRHGFVPILAHVDRYEVFRKQPKLVDEVLDMGGMIQLNADSVLGENGFWVKRFCHRLLKNGCVQFIASDAHDITHRSSNLSKCYSYVKKKYGSADADALFRRNALEITENVKETL